MTDRERVRAAIDASVDAASRLREETPETEIEARLLAVIDGWGRGLAAGLEELAVAVEELRRLAREPGEATPAPERQPAETATDDNAERGADERDEADREPATVEQLNARAAASLQETRTLRRQASGQNEDSDDDKTDAMSE
jgi:hypothetical protein